MYGPSRSWQAPPTLSTSSPQTALPAPTTCQEPVAPTPLGLKLASLGELPVPLSKSYFQLALPPNPIRLQVGFVTSAATSTSQQNSVAHSDCPSHNRHAYSLALVPFGSFLVWREGSVACANFCSQGTVCPEGLWNQLVPRALACRQLAAPHGNSVPLLMSIECQALHWRRGLELYSWFHQVFILCRADVISPNSAASHVFTIGMLH